MFTSPIWVFTSPIPVFMMADLAVHDAPIWVFTMDRCTHSVSLTQLSPVSAIASYTLVVRDTTGTYRLRATHYFGRPPAGPDTITVQVRAVWWDAIAAASPEGLLPILAADSTVRQIRLVPVGTRFVPDTVDLWLRRPQGAKP